jgi:hypothetical protein
MTWTKTKTAAVAGMVILLAAGIGFVAIKTVRSANAGHSRQLGGHF